MSFRSNIIAFDGARSGDRSVKLKEEYRPTVNACRQVLLKSMPRLVERMFETLDDALYALADKAGTDIQQTSFFDSLRELRRERERVENEFNGRILTQFDRFWLDGPSSLDRFGSLDDMNEDAFSLMDDAQLEEDLAVGNMISKGENRFFRDLYALDQRFGFIANGIKVNSKSNPVAPAAVAGAFRDLVVGLEVDVAVKLIVFKQFEREVIDYLGGIYDELNHLLTKAGIIPKLTRPVRRHPVSPALRSESQPEVPRQPLPLSPEEEAQQARVFAAFQQLLRRRRGSQSATRVEDPDQHYFEAGDVLSALTSIQHALPQISSVVEVESPDAIKENLQQQLQVIRQNAVGYVVGRQEEDAIDIISMLFEFILDDRSLPDAMKAMLSRLQIPMLKVAIQDKSFFSKKSHPARRLLNSLAQAAVGWSEAIGRAEGGLYAQIELIVGRILDEFDQNIELFVELNEQFSKFLETENRGARIAEERAAQVTQGKEQLSGAKQHVYDEISSRLARCREVPSVVAAILQEAWKDVLLLILLRKGEESSEWSGAVGLMDSLLWSVEPKGERTERQELLNQIPPMLKALRKGMNEISFDQHRMTQLFKELQACHVNCLKGNRVTNRITASTDLAKRLEPAPSTASKASAADEEVCMDQFHEQAEALAVGSWIEVREQSGKSFRLKLAWKSEVSGNCLFVNRKGIKMAELTAQGLASWFRSGKAEMIGKVETPMMDRALGAMLDVLKKSGNGDVSRRA